MTCVWPLPSRMEHLAEEWNTAPDECRDYAVDLASRSLTLLTGGRVGTCPVTIRPQAHDSCPVPMRGNHDSSPYGMYPVNWGGQWYNGCCPNASLCEVSLPAPVGQVDQVKANGVVLDPADYRVDSGHLLTWVGTGECPFPHRQDPSLGDDQPGTMSVTYVNAHLPGQAGSMAMSILAYEFLRACIGKACKLPDGVTTLVRQGVSYTITPGHWPDGKTGIADVDSFIALWNPRGMLVPSQVWSPDLPVSRTIGG